MGWASRLHLSTTTTAICFWAYFGINGCTPSAQIRSSGWASTIRPQRAMPPAHRYLSFTPSAELFARLLSKTVRHWGPGSKVQVTWQCWDSRQQVPESCDRLPKLLWLAVHKVCKEFASLPAPRESFWKTMGGLRLLKHKHYCTKRTKK